MLGEVLRCILKACCCVVLKQSRLAACGMQLASLLETKRASRKPTPCFSRYHTTGTSCKGAFGTTKASVQPRRSFVLMLWSTKYHDLGQHHRHRRPAANTVRTCHDAPLHPYVGIITLAITQPPPRIASMSALTAT